MKLGYFTFDSSRTNASFAKTCLSLLFSLCLFGFGKAQMSVSIDYTSPNCPGYNSGLASAVVDGGTGPYNYYWSNGQTGQTISNPAAGTLSVTVSDATYSQASASTMVAIPTEIIIVLAGAPDPCVPGANYLTASVTGGTAPYAYQWSNGGTSNTLSGLTQAGYYFVTVTDYNGCQEVKGAQYSPPVQVSLQLNPSPCGGTCDGSIEAKIDQGQGPFTFQWNNGPQPTSQLQTPAPEGPYTVTVTDGQGCTDVASGFLDDPDPLALSFDLSNACGSPSNVTASASGGTPPYTYQWAYGQSGPTAYNLQPGTWFLTVYDAHNCAFTQTVTVADSDLEIGTVSTPAACAGTGGGTATVNTTGGSGTFTYLWSNGETTPTVNDLEAGDYTVTVTDVTGCEQVAEVTVEEATSFTVTTSSTPYRCDGQGGTATVTLSGGSGNFTYQWNDPQQQNTGEAIDLEPGIYEVIITDADGCSATEEIEILDGSMQPAVTAAAASCDDNGSAQISVGNANGPLTYEWSPGVPSGSSNSPSISNLAAGLYTVTVTDADGCEETLDVEIPDESFDVAIEAAQQGCADEAVGILQASIVGGNPNTNYVFEWSNWGQSNTIGGLLPGSYEVTVSDPTGCEVVASFELESSPPIEFLANTLNSPCEGLANGNVELQVTGAAPFSYQWSNGGTDPTASNLAAGNYTVTVTDANGCTRVEEITVEEEPLEIALTLDNPTCENSLDGTATVEVSGGGAAPFDYEWSTGSTDAQLTDLAAGSYDVTVTDAFGCVGVENFVVEPEVDISVDFTFAALDCDDNGVIVDFAGQSANAATWEWTLANGQTYTGQNPQIVVDQSPMEITLTVTSAEGCEASASQMVEAAPISLTLGDAATICQNDEYTFDLVVDNPGGGTLTYDWQPEALIVSGQGTPNPVFATTDVGVYNVTVAVSNGSCTVNDEATMTVTEAITVDPAAVSFSQCEDLTVDFTNTGGVTGTWYFDYPNPDLISNEVNPSFTYPAAGGYEVAFVPDGGCAETLSLAVEVSLAPEVAFTVSADDCNDPITVTFTNTSNVTIDNYLWDFGPLGTSTDENPTLTVSGSQTVEATLVATYGNGCEQTAFDEITVEAFVAPTIEDQQHICEAGLSTGLNPNGDDTYTYEWTGGNIGVSTEVNPTVTVDETTTYTVVITAPNGCSATQEVTVEVPAEEFALLPIDDIVACDPGPVVISALTNTPATEWTWAINETFDSPVGSDQDLEVETNNMAITYYVMATNEHGCTDMTSFSVMNAAIEIDFDNAFEVCKGDMLVLDITLNNATVDDITNWQPFNPLENPVYANEDFTFDVTNDQGCMGHGEMTVKVVEFTDPLEVEADPAEVWTGQSTQLYVTEDPNWTYAWAPEETLDDPTVPNPVASPDGTQSYVVVVTETATGCRQSLEIEVKSKDIICEEPYIFVPTAFTPNGDGTNDVLKVEGFNIEELYFTIYDRWGEMVFETDNKEEGWDGTFRGATVSGDVYGYYLKVRCPGGLEFFKKGNITVLR